MLEYETLIRTQSIVDDRLVLGLAEAKLRAWGELIAKIRATLFRTTTYAAHTHYSARHCIATRRRRSASMYSEGDLKRLSDLGISEKTARAALEVNLFALSPHFDSSPGRLSPFVRNNEET